ncbi:Uncharacterised protein g11214 [Pycnogonum litorale]
MGLLCYLAIVSLLAVVHASIPSKCITKETKTFECDCDINGTSYENITYDGVSEECRNLTIEKMYDHMDTTADNNVGGSFAFCIKYQTIQALRATLFPSNIQVIGVRLESLHNLSSFQPTLFQNQQNNIRDVEITAYHSYFYPPTVLSGLTKMRRLSVRAESFKLSLLKLGSFNLFPSKDTLVEASLATLDFLNYDAVNLTDLKQLRSFTLQTSFIPRAHFDKLAENLPEHLFSLVLRKALFPKLTTSMVRKVLTRCQSLRRLAFVDNTMAEVEIADWSFLNDFKKGLKKIYLTDNILFCNCGLHNLTQVVKVIAVPGCTQLNPETDWSSC